MTVGELIELRQAASLTQTAMAHRMGLSMRAYQDLEGREAGEALSNRHLILVERASLTLAIEKRDIDLALPRVRREALDLAAMIRGG